MDTMKKILEGIIKFSIYALVFLLPVFWLPFSFEIYEFSKQYLLMFLTSIGFLAWLAKMIFIDREIRVRKTTLDFLVLAFMLVAVFSAYFSVDRNSSLFGFYGRFSNGLIGLLCLGTFYFLVTNNTKDKTEHPESRALFDSSFLIKLFLASVALIVLTTYFSVFGVWQKISSSLPQFMLQKTFNATGGSLEGLAVFLSVVAVLLTGKLMLKAKSRASRMSVVFNNVLLAAIMVLLVIVDFNPSWLVLLISLGLFFAFAFATRVFKEDINKLVLPIALIIISVIFLFSSTDQLLSLNLPKEQVLNQKMSWSVGFGAMAESWKNGFFGSGIGTWYYDFSKFKPLEFNQLPWWQIRFDRAGSHIAEIVGTTGFLGLLSYAGLIVMFFLVFWLLRRNLDFFPYVMAVFALLISQFVYYQNTVLAFSFWFVLALGVSLLQSSTRSYAVVSFKEFPEMSLIFSTLLIVLVILTSVGYYFLVRFYYADMYYAKAQSTLSVEERTKLLEEAVNLNPNSATYQIILSRFSLLQLLAELEKSSTEQDASKIQNLITQSINQTKETTENFPNSVAAWETLGIVYRDIQALVSGTVDWAIKAFEQAIELDGNNPVLHTELGKLYVAAGDIEKAKQSFEKAQVLKPDYVDASIQEALIYERSDNLDEAIKQLEELISKFPLNIESRFQLGRLYFNQGKTDDAILQFEIIVSLVPNHSNSLYSLGIAYAKKGETDKAISVLERTLELNPGNQDLMQKLQELKGINVK